jgi:hypothetical protein
MFVEKLCHIIPYHTIHPRGKRPHIADYWAISTTQAPKKISIFYFNVLLTVSSFGLEDR